jgi:hypothetical protein
MMLAVNVTIEANMTWSDAAVVEQRLRQMALDEIERLDPYQDPQVDSCVESAA